MVSPFRRLGGRGSRRKPRLARLSLVVATICAGTVLAPTAAQADDPLQTLLNLLPTGITLSSLLPLGPDLASGTVRSNGAPEAAAVTLYAWPSNDSLSSLNEGDTINVQPVATALAGSDGTFDLRIPNLAALVPYADSTGIVNLEMVALDPNGGESRWSFSRQLAGLTLNPDGTVLTAATGLLDPVTSLLGAATSTTLDMVTGAVNPASLNSDVAGADMGCAFTLTQKLSPSWVVVGGTFSSTSGVSDTMTYTHGATSTMGVGLDVNGYGTDWKASGTDSKSSTSTVTFPTQTGAVSHFHRTQWQYAKWTSNCGPNATPLGGHGEVEVRPYTYVAGAQEVSTSARTLNYCTTFPADSGFTLSSTSATTWTDGVSISNYIGINLSAESGYSSTVETHYHFSVAHHLCGYVNYPGSSPGYLAAKP